MAMKWSFEVMSEKFHVQEIYTSWHYALKQITKVHNYWFIYLLASIVGVYMEAYIGKHILQIRWSDSDINMKYGQ
jgi:hypothetical protein